MTSNYEIKTFGVRKRSENFSSKNLNIREILFRIQETPSDFIEFQNISMDFKELYLMEISSFSGSHWISKFQKIS